MKMLSSIVMCLAVCVVHAQAPQGGAQPGPATQGSANKPIVPTARVAGYLIAADTGRPLRRATVTLMAQPSKVVRIALTDRDGRYEFTRVAAGRYGVTPSKDGYVFVAENPFSGGRGLEIVDGEDADRTDFALSRGSVISGRITDEFGEPVAGITVQAARYQFRPSGQRQLIMGSSGNYFMPAATNDLGEFRIFGLRPGSYFVSARPDSSNAVGISPTGSGLTGVDSNDGLTTTFYPGTANVSDAQVVQVGLMQNATASFTLVPARMSRVSGTVLDSQGRPLTSARVELRSTTGVVGAWTSGTTTAFLSSAGRFTLANVAPGDYMLHVRPNQTPVASGQQPALNEYVALPLSITGEDVDLALTSTPGISVSGRVIFEGGSNIAQPNLRISAAPEEDARNALSYNGPDGGQVGADGQFHIPSVYGKVVFRTSGLPVTVMLKSVTLGDVDITDTPFDATKASDDVTNLRVVLVDKQGRISGYARNERGEIQYNYRLVTYPANPKPGNVTVRYQHNTSPNVKGQFNIGRMPPGEYVGLAVKGVHPGEEWDPELRKRVEQLGKRFTLKEGEELVLEMPYVE
jgi:protocatechuate 3,4-dioxygenase beta subunit